MSDVRISTSGPLFDHRADDIIFRFCRRLEDAIGERGVTLIRAYLPTQYKKDPWTSTGHYQSQVQTELQVDALRITDDRVVYGPWLEGVGSRNFPATRFRGYHAFREMTHVLDRSVNEIARHELPIYVEELNGI